MNLSQYLLEQLENQDIRIINQISKDVNIDSKLIKKAYEKYKLEFDEVPGSWKTNKDIDTKIRKTSPEKMLQGHVLVFIDHDNLPHYYDAEDEQWIDEIDIKE